MHLRFHARLLRCGVGQPLKLAATVIAAIGLPLGAVRAQGLPDYPGPGIPGPAGFPTGTTTATGPEAPVLRRGALGWWTEATLNSQATLTNNSNYGESTDRESDLILELTPVLRFNREGARLRVNGAAAVDLLYYVDGTQASRALPQVDILANLEAVENLFFIDGSIVANQELVNPFLPRAEFSSANNQYTYAQARLAPYLQGKVGQNLSWLIRSDNSYTWTTQTDDPLSNAYYAQHLAQFVRNPTPLGLTLRASRDLTRIQDQLQPDQTLDTALAIFDYAVSPQLTVGLRGGYENTTYTAEETSGSIYGANISWRPTPVSSVVGYWEQRFYGPSYQFEASHRQRRLATTLTGYRTITTYPQVLLQVPSTNNVSALLDAILVARFPDPTLRQQQVNELITRQALPESLPAGAFIYNQSANILTGANLSFGLLGVRNTAALNFFYLKTRLLPDARVPTTFLAFNNSEQLGAGLTLSHQLSPVMNLNGTISGYQTKGFDQTEGLDTRQGLASVQVNWQLSPNNTFFLGTRYQYERNRSSAATFFTNTSEAAIFAGLFHRL